MLEFRPRMKGSKERKNGGLLIIIIELIMLLQRQRQLINFSYLYVFNVLCKPQIYSHRYSNVSQLRLKLDRERRREREGREGGVREVSGSASNLLSQAVRGF